MGVYTIVSQRSRTVAASFSYRYYRLERAGVKVQFCVLYLPKVPTVPCRCQDLSALQVRWWICKVSIFICSAAIQD